MKTTLMLFLICAVLFATSLAADTVEDRLIGTWSGSWLPTDGVRDAMTIELKYDNAGKLTGRFLAPAFITLTQATFNPKTRSLTLEAVDPSGKPYKVLARVQGTQIEGMATVGEQTGAVDLIKWMFTPRMNTD